MAAVEIEASASSRLDFGVQSLELSPGVADCELPIHTPLFGVGFLRPSSDLGLKKFEVLPVVKTRFLGL